jgi:hypothetical protein
MKKLITAFLLLLFSPLSSAAILITAVEANGNVVFSTPGGTLNMVGTYVVSNFNSSLAYIDPNSAELNLGASGAGTRYGGLQLSGPAGGFGPGPGGGVENIFADSATGSLFGVSGFVRLATYFDVPESYSSGDLLGASTATYSNQTFNSLGVNPGTYVWSWQRDSITLNVVPIPAPFILFGSGLGLLGWFRRRARFDPEGNYLF